ncbi:Fc.00g017880.m01.CDS01 [Cosmosporella sp. VM-42]
MAQASRLTKDLTLAGSTTTIPRLIYGTAWKKEKTEDLVYQALKNGFRGVDTAAQPKHYDEPGVGRGVCRAVKDGIVKREDLFIQTKFSPPGNQGEKMPYSPGVPLKDQVHMSVKQSLRHFVDAGPEMYLDSVVLHSPLATMEETLIAWKVLQQYAPSAIRSVGISNTSLEILRELYDKADLKPSVVQNRFHGDTAYEVDLRAFCRERNIIFQSFWTLSANPALCRSAPVKEIAAKTGVPRTAAYYSLVLGLEGITILDGTTNEAHMTEDLEGIETVGSWAEGDGAADWVSALAKFKELIGET